MIKNDRNGCLVVLFDYDSMIYKAVYKIVDFSIIRGWFIDGKSRAWMIDEIVNLTLNRLSNMGDRIFEEIENTGIEIDGIEYFLTNCYRSVRKLKYPEYKANRKKKPNKWVRIIREKLIEMNFAAVDEQWEADDLIKDRVVELGRENCIVLSIDKDLKQIAGYHFDYFQPAKKDENGKNVTDEFGNIVRLPCRGIDVVSELEAEAFFWLQMLMGDTTDNIKGVPKVGKVRAKKILENSDDYRSATLEKYISHFGEEEGKYQFDLHILLLGLGINHRIE